MSICAVPWFRMEVHENRLCPCNLIHPQLFWHAKRSRYWDFLEDGVKPLVNSLQYQQFRTSMAATEAEGACGAERRCGAPSAFPNLPVHALPSIAENYRLVKEDWEARSPILRGVPPVWTVSTGARCDMRCVMCPIDHSLDIPPLTTDAATQLREAAELALNWTVVGGEPLHSPAAVLDSILPTPHPCRKVMMLTSLSAPTDVVAAIIDRLTHITVSLCAPSERIYNKVQVGGNFRWVMDNIQLAVPRTIADCSQIIMASTLPTLAYMGPFLDDLGFQFLTPTPMVNIKGPDEEDIFGKAATDATTRELIRQRELAEELTAGRNIVCNWGIFDSALLRLRTRFNL